MAHIPVLQKEVIKYLDPKSNENFIDCTLNGGGHASAILEKTGPRGKLLGIDLDSEVIRTFKEKSSAREFKNRVIVINGNFADLKKIIAESRLKQIDGILLDLGFSSWHTDESKRGFSFQRNEPLDMRYDLKGQLTAEKIVNYWSQSDIERIFREYGEESFSRQIAEEIVKARRIVPIKSTFQVSEIIKKSVPSWYLGRKIHFATKVFQALRIAVNDELNNLKDVLPQAAESMNKGGRMAVISFHSLEDKIVKDFFKYKEKEGLLKILTKKPIEPQKEEIKINPRSRSAKLRAAEKI